MSRQILGQHFLKDRDLAKKIVDAVLPFSGEILEIGPGKGILTEIILKVSGKKNLFAVEKDPKLAGKLKQRFGEKINMVEDSILNVSLKDIIPGKSINIVGNIPYYISREIVTWIVLQGIPVTKGVLLVQKEFFEKLNSFRGPEGMIFNTIFNMKRVFDIRPGSFSPPPEVTSTLFRFERSIPEKLSPGTESEFLDFLKISFRNRRKTILNNLKKFYRTGRIERYLSDLKLEKSVRAEQLSPLILLNIYKKIGNDQDRPEIL